MRQQEFVRNSTGLTDLEVKNTIQLLLEGATVPFIARYRKENTGGLDEVKIAQIRDTMTRYDELVKRQQSILSKIQEQGKMRDELKQRIERCFDMNELEDLYLPFKQKRLTKGEKARKRGLEPLAKMIMAQRGGNPEVMAEKFIKGDVDDEQMAIDGAKDIMAEWISETVFVRAKLRKMFERKAVLTSKLVKDKREEADKYKDYVDFSQSLFRVPSHRLLAIYRAGRAGILTVKARPEDEEAISLIERFFVKGSDRCAQVVGEACKEAYRRLLRPSLENEAMTKAKEKADREAIEVFRKNLRQLLLAPPLGAKRVLAIDPGFRTGCKVVCLDASGNLLTNATIYPHPPQKEMAKAKAKISGLVEAYKIDAIAIGDGTAGRETERFIQQIRFSKTVQVFVVREDGASIYSASPIARKEFPDFDVTVRGAVSIGRRLMDPLAELVKIDPKSVGVGQYQHEVNQTLLKSALDDTVISCVNTVGVEINTASSYLLSYVSGLGPTLAENIVKFRTENGAFTTIDELKRVKRLGEKSFEQAAGFVRIRDGKNPLDNSSVHPESYSMVEQMAERLRVSVSDLIGNEEKLKQLEPNGGMDRFTFDDIIAELKKPGRDPRSTAKVLDFDHRIRTMADLKEGMILSGIVTNVTNFGAFVNIGIKENGLIHKSNLADSYVEDPSQYIALHEHVEVRVIEIDVARKRIGLKRIES